MGHGCVTNRLDNVLAKPVSQAFGAVTACLTHTISLLEILLAVRFVTAISWERYQEQFVTKSMDNVFACFTVREESVVSVNQVRK